MIYHMLPGDAQVAAFKESGIKGELLVCRECLVEGELKGETLNEFFQNRAAFINDAYDSDPSIYNATVASQFKKLAELNDSDEINLWFEYELFCAANMWFCIDLISNTGASVFRVEPVYRTPEDRWNGFGGATPEQMRECFRSRINLTADDIALGSELWRAYRTNDRSELERLSKVTSSTFPYLNELCGAAVAKDSRPSEIVRQIQAEGITAFDKLFPEFRKRAGVYGFGDSQVKRLMSDPPAAAGA
jgi:hypothetical protein